ncbi:MAG: glycosyltransferase [Armatimonadota bacterium]
MQPHPKMSLDHPYRILILTGYYLPAFKGGGPIRTLQAIVDRLGDEFAFYILTRDRDLGDTSPFAGVRYGNWCSVGKAQVRYLAARECTIWNFCKLLNRIPYDLLYLNSFFDPVFTIQVLALHRLGLIPRRPIVLAPRGEFSPGALQQKPLKKKVYIRLVRFLRLYRFVIWHASNEQEGKYIFGTGISSYQSQGNLKKVFIVPNIIIAPDTIPIDIATYQGQVSSKERGSLRITFLSRISQKKNLEFAIGAISNLVGRISFDIYGPIDNKPFEQVYWERCSSLLRGLPANITTTYHGPVNPTEVSQIMASHDLFILPTLGENFGHVIIESLSSGCPVLISDRTPWHNLAECHSGWDLPLERPQAFRDVLQSLVDMDIEEYSVWRRGAQAYAQCYLSRDTSVELQRKLFLSALGGPPYNV